MLFNSYEFILIFLPIVLAGFFLISRLGEIYGAVWLVTASLFFYGYWNYAYLGLLIISIVFNYSVGIWISFSIRIGNIKKSKAILFIGLLVNLFLLGYYKYSNFFISHLNQVTHLDWVLDDIILPLGISFFTFTQIAFLVDAYQKKVDEPNFIHYALFVTYFPHLIAGPVLHHQQMMPQFSSKKTYYLDRENLTTGLTFLTIGMAKKVLLADNFSEYARPIFQASASGVELHFFAAWIGAIAFTMQLYFDFSGYSDMAIGISKLFGVDLPINFNSPYKAKNIIDFWRRWHITLSLFLRDYLYIPLGGNKKGSVHRYCNLLVTMLLGGLWHGANWTLVIWGGVHGIYLCVNHGWNHIFIKCDSEKGAIRKFFSVAITFISVVFAWVFFRSESLHSAYSFILSMLGLNGVSLPKYFMLLDHYLVKYSLKVSYIGLFDGLNVPPNLFYFFTLFSFSFILIWGFPNSQELAIKFKKSEMMRSLYLPIVLGILMALSMLSINRVSEFLYFQF